MWPAIILAAEGTDWRPLVLPAAFAGIAAIAAAWLALRGTFRQATVNHEVEFDKRVHARIQTLEDQVAKHEQRAEVLTADRDRYREMHAKLRLDVIAAGLDPDRLHKAVDDG